MKKATTILACVVFAIAFATCAHAASELVPVTLPEFDVTINGVTFDNSDSRYPFLLYRNITYFPLTWRHDRFAGLSFTYQDQVLRNGYVLADTAGLFVSWQPIAEPEWEPYSGAEEDNRWPLFATFAAGNCQTAIQTTVATRQPEYPILRFRDVLYLPLTYENVYEQLGWEYRFSREEGLVLDSRNAVRCELPYSDIYFNVSLGAATVKLYAPDYAQTHDSYVYYPTIVSSDGVPFRFRRAGKDEVVLDLGEMLYERYQILYIANIPRMGANSVPIIRGSVVTFPCRNKDERAPYGLGTVYVQIDFDTGEIHLMET